MRSSRVSPMPIRMPVVNGTQPRRPAGWSPAGRRGACRASRNAGRRAAQSRSLVALQHDALADRDLAQPRRCPSRVITPGLICGSSPVSLEHQRRTSRQIGDRGRVAERRQRLARGAVAQLGLVAQREQRLGAAGACAGARDREHLVGARVGGARPRAALRRTCSSGRRRGRDGSAE